MDKRKFKRLAKKAMAEPNLIDITNDDELMDMVLKKTAEMQEETIKESEKKEGEE